MTGNQHRQPTETLGRVRGASVPMDEIEIHQANGWTIAELLPDGSVFMAPPPSLAERRAG